MNLTMRFGERREPPKRPNEEWPIVTETNEWGISTQINSEDMLAGKYWVRWPDRNETLEDVKLEHTPFTYGDMGHTYESSHTRAYVLQHIHGVETKVYIVGLRVKLNDA